MGTVGKEGRPSPGEAGSAPRQALTEVLARLAAGRGPEAVPLRLGLRWGSDALVLPALGLGLPVSRWPRETLGRRLVGTGVVLGAASLSAALTAREARRAKRSDQRRLGARLLLAPGTPPLRRALGAALLLVSLD